MSQLFDLKNPVHLLATGFGSGLLKPAPGTWGTLVALLIYCLLLVHLPLVYFWVVLAVSIVAGVYLCGKTASDAGTHDHGAIVWDEFAGYWLTVAIVTALLGHHLHLYWALAGFVLFRLFDITKPFPIGLLDKKVHGGLGIMLDDLVAGVYAAACLYLAIYLYSQWLGISI